MKNGGSEPIQAVVFFEGDDIFTLAAIGELQALYSQKDRTVKIAAATHLLAELGPGGLALFNSLRLPGVHIGNGFIEIDGLRLQVRRENGSVILYAGNQPVGSSLRGLRGRPGPQGEPGKGAQGPQGMSIRGPQGPQGRPLAGPRGNVGPQGKSIQGERGERGPQGLQGEVGETIVGPQGASIRGERGLFGERGPQGKSIQGEHGERGPQGASIKGDIGPQGEAIRGPRGLRGIVGPQGETIVGPQGDQGEPGESIQGPQGQRGERGESIEGKPGKRGPQGTQGRPGRDAKDVGGGVMLGGGRGPQGVPGADGIGTQGPQGMPGGAGASALDDLTDVNVPSPIDNDVLSWDDATGQWIAVAPSGSVGPQGDPGPQGDDGGTGPQGDQGDSIQGPQGDDGNDGPQGDQGAESTVPGPQGDQGDSVQGPQGDDGDPGPQGDQGADGPQGNQGDDSTIPGPQGDQGDSVQGPQGNDGGTGPQGNNGGDGPQGDQGGDGGAGPQGNQGSDGGDGPQGNQGNDGGEGPQGSDGADGPQGDQGGDGGEGPQGDDGGTGPQGNQGTQGPQGDPAAGGNHTILDGSVHSDSVADSVSAGSLIIGNDTPKWDELVITVPGAANLLNVLGVATGETTPSYKVLFDGTAPEAIGTAAAGTGVVAAHRNHVHAVGTHYITHCMEFMLVGNLVTGALPPYGLIPGYTSLSYLAGEHGAFSAVRGYVQCTGGTGTGGQTAVIVIEAASTVTFADSVTLFTLTLAVDSSEHTDAVLDNAWDDDHIYVRARCTSQTLTTPPGNVRVQFFYKEQVFP